MHDAEYDAGIAARNGNEYEIPIENNENYSTDMNRTRDNFRFIEEIQKKPIPRGYYTKKIFGFIPFDVDDILRNNIYNRGITASDEDARVFLGWHIDQCLKYQKKKRKLGFDSWWLIILLGGGGLVVLLMIFLFMSGGGGAAAGGGLAGGVLP